jgi:hypothetical protein
MNKPQTPSPSASPRRSWTRWSPRRGRTRRSCPQPLRVRLIVPNTFLATQLHDRFDSPESALSERVLWDWPRVGRRRCRRALGHEGHSASAMARIATFRSG